MQGSPGTVIIDCLVYNMLSAFSELLSWETSKQGPNPEVMKVLPVNFTTEHENMLSHLHMLVNRVFGYS